MPTAALGLVFLSTILHASWNLLAHARRNDQTLFLRAALVTGLVGLGPVLWSEWTGSNRFPPMVWLLLVITGLFQGLYFLGLTRGYGSGDFTVVYPVARALPVLILALVDAGRGQVPSALGWLGIIGTHQRRHQHRAAALRLGAPRFGDCRDLHHRIATQRPHLV